MKPSSPSPAIRQKSRWLLIPLGLLLLNAGCHREETPTATTTLPPVVVTIAPVETHGLTATEEVVGTVRAQLHSAVEAKLTSRIEAFLVVPGQTVHRGDTLVTLDLREMTARMDSAVALRDQATRDFERTRKLVKDGAATAAELDALQARQRVAAAAVVEAETQLAHTRVMAPFDGVITRKLADVGDLATPGRPLVEMEDPARLRFEADLPEALLDRVQMGVKLPVHIPSLKNALEGVISELAPVAESVSRTFLVKFDLPAVPGLRAGQFGRVAVPTGESSVAHVPASAVLQRGQLEYVFVVDHNIARLRIIRTGKHFGSDVEVVSGLETAERIVATDPGKLRDGQPVEVRP